MNNCDTYFMIMRIFLALRRRHGRVIDGDNWLRNPPHPEDKPTLFLHTLLPSCLPAVGSCILCMLRVSFFFLVSLLVYIHIRGPEGSTNNAQSILGILLEGHLGLLQNLQKTHNLIFKVNFLCQKSIKLI